jgi:AcrR family transcriptional regulator
VKGNETRERICQAAMRLADRDGLLTLTLENVAVESGLSKGGVLHHFPNKEALLLGVIQFFADRVEGMMTRLVADDPNPSFRWIRAMINMSGSASSDPTGISSDSMDRFMLSILAVAIHNPELLKPVQMIGQRLRGRLTAVPEEGLEQLMMWLVVDGLFLWKFVGLIQPNDPLPEQVMQALRNRLAHLTDAQAPSATLTTPTRKKVEPTKRKATRSTKRSGASK